MPINQLVKFCHSEYLLKIGQCSQCPNKAQGACISKNCSTCFQEMFFGTDRTFNCECSTYSYVCRYIYQYSSEILHLLKLVTSFFKDDSGIKIDKLNIMSIGCGPCSEVFAIESFLKEIDYDNRNVSFTGFDSNNIWSNVHNEIPKVLPFSTNILYQDCFTHIQSSSNYTYPNILIMNYLLSDICKHGNITQFIDDVVKHIIDKMPSRSMVIINDINLWDPRDYYKSLIQKINIRNNAEQIPLSFIGYNYGYRHSCSHTFFY
ncbi:hypothetical protein Barb4_00305 [Bacteroidales bacterium Barb4]|nr:hypothetical protein Barb4_00305 [Bacteroidales bacterium Barb4]